METSEADRFSLFQEPAGSDDRRRLVMLGRISREVILSCSHHSTRRPIWPESADPAYERSASLCMYFNDLRVEDRSTRVVFPIEGADKNRYFVQLSPLHGGYDLFVGRAVQYVDETWMPDLHPGYVHGEAAKRLRLENCSVDQAYFHGLSQVATMITAGQFDALQPMTDPARVASNRATGAVSAKTPQAVADERSSLPARTSVLDLKVFDSAWFTYAGGLVGAASFMALTIGPGWLGFLVIALPSSLLASWAIASHA